MRQCWNLGQLLKRFECQIHVQSEHERCRISKCLLHGGHPFFAVLPLHMLVVVSFGFTAGVVLGKDSTSTVCCILLYVVCDVLYLLRV